MNEFEKWLVRAGLVREDGSVVREAVEELVDAYVVIVEETCRERCGSSNNRCVKYCVVDTLGRVEPAYVVALAYAMDVYGDPRLAVKIVDMVPRRLRDVVDEMLWKRREELEVEQ